MPCGATARTQPAPTTGEEGYALVALVVALFLVLLALSVAAPRVAQELKRDREEEAVHRAQQYVRAIQLFYRKTGRYPGSMEELEKSNNQRFLRKRYADPLTGKPDWRLIKLGEAKTTVKWIFGKPLAGLPASTLGGAGGTGSSTVMGGSSGGVSSGIGAIGGSTSTPDNATATGNSTNAADAQSATSSSGSTTAASGAGASGGTAGGATTAGGSGGLGTGTPTGGLFVGVGSSAQGAAIITVNEQTDYSKWEFLYDPRLDKLLARISVFGGGLATADPTASNGLSSGSSNPTGSTSPASGTNSGTSTGTGTGTAPPASSGTP
ncbi:MAG: type II secretion system protein [Acidobacteriota bacterium]|nr:type II secretion system protein [Acidobacteriota bacterium]